MAVARAAVQCSVAPGASISSSYQFVGAGAAGPGQAAHTRAGGWPRDAKRRSPRARAARPTSRQISHTGAKMVKMAPKWSKWPKCQTGAEWLSWRQTGQTGTSRASIASGHSWAHSASLHWSLMQVSTLA